MTKIKFQDVAHMYLGCNVQFEQFEKDEETGEVIRRWQESGRLEHHNFGEMLARKVKPVLRSIKDLPNANFDKYGYKHVENGDLQISLMVYMACREGFDIFGLIDSGEAIDAATLGEEVKP